MSQKPIPQSLTALATGKPLSELIRMLEIGGFSVTVVVRHRQQTGEIQFSIGVPVAAAMDKLTAEDAVLTMLAWKNPQIALQTTPVKSAVPITWSCQELLEYAVQHPGLLKPVKAAPAPSTPVEERVEPKGVRSAVVSVSAVPQATQSPLGGNNMSNVATMSNVKEVLAQCMQIEGAIAVAIADYSSGMALGTAGGGMNLDVAAAGNTDVVRAKMRVMKELGVQDGIEDILITLGKQYHLIRMSPKHGSLFFYLALDKNVANLAMARHKLTTLANALVI